MPIDRLRLRPRLRPRPRLRATVLAALTVPLLLAATVPVGAQTRSVSMVDDRFKPVAITIPVGDSLRWVNNGKAAHTVTSRVNGLFDSSLVPAGNSFSHRFSRAGTYRYYCFLHPGMNGTVFVRSAPKPQPKPRPHPRPKPHGGGGSGGPLPNTSTLAAADGTMSPTEPWLLPLFGFAALSGVAIARRRFAGVRTRHG